MTWRKLSAWHLPSVRVRVAVPRKVVQELDGLKEGKADGGGSGRQSEVASLAQSVNRALMKCLQQGGGQGQGQGEGQQPQAERGGDAVLVVQGPADAGKMRVQMKAEWGRAWQILLATSYHAI